MRLGPAAVARKLYRQHGPSLRKMARSRKIEEIRFEHLGGDLFGLLLPRYKAPGFIMTVHRPLRGREKRLTIAHEIGHTYFQGPQGSWRRRHPESREAEEEWCERFGKALLKLGAKWP
jgi:Zn-dependent peptidase ImmA (M78 family)